LRDPENPQLKAGGYGSYGSYAAGLALPDLQR